MTTNNHVSTLTIDSKALIHNLNFFKSRLNEETKILVVVKAEAYGSSSELVAKFIESHVDYFAVAYTHEGIVLRNSGITKPILVLYPQIENIKQIVTHRLEPSLYNFRIFDAFLKFADEEPLMNYPIHIKFNTGLNRLGFWHTDIPKILSELKASNNVFVKSIYSHLAASEDPNEVEFTTNQINNFAYIVKQVYEHLDYEPMIHILNTSGIINYPQAQFDMVRLGIGLYGFGNEESITNQLQNTHNLSSVITQIHIVQPGETIGYNRGFTANRITKIATIPVGHADGISRKLGNKNGFVIINEQAVPIVGNVCMDMLMVDVTEIECNEGDSVILFNHQSHINYISDKYETIPYDVITNISQRIKRVIV